MSELNVRLEELLPIMTECLEAGHSYTFTPRGISMLPMLRGGRDTVTLSPIQGELRKYDLPLYRRPDGKFILHRIVKTGTTYTCAGDNQFILEEGVERSWFIAVVTSFRRNGKEYRCDQLSYRIYCVLWHHTRRLRWFWFRVKRKLKRIFCGE
ncbi:MAG: S24/S26 family peptidase [Clostridia bacterium]|nr:S24/S26 family peptidase [Clostridia bacterium]